MILCKYSQISPLRQQLRAQESKNTPDATDLDENSFSGEPAEARAKHSYRIQDDAGQDYHGLRTKARCRRTPPGACVHDITSIRPCMYVYTHACISARISTLLCTHVRCSPKTSHRPSARRKICSPGWQSLAGRERERERERERGEKQRERQSDGTQVRAGS